MLQNVRFFFAVNFFLMYIIVSLMSFTDSYQGDRCMDLEKRKREPKPRSQGLVKAEKLRLLYRQDEQNMRNRLTLTVLLTEWLAN